MLRSVFEADPLHTVDASGSSSLMPKRNGLVVLGCTKMYYYQPSTTDSLVYNYNVIELSPYQIIQHPGQILGTDASDGTLAYYSLNDGSERQQDAILKSDPAGKIFVHTVDASVEVMTPKITVSSLLAASIETSAGVPQMTIVPGQLPLMPQGLRSNLIHGSNLSVQLDLTGPDAKLNADLRCVYHSNASGSRMLHFAVANTTTFQSKIDTGSNDLTTQAIKGANLWDKAGGSGNGIKLLEFGSSGRVKVFDRDWDWNNLTLKFCNDVQTNYVSNQSSVVHLNATSNSATTLPLPTTAATLRTTTITSQDAGAAFSIPNSNGAIVVGRHVNLNGKNITSGGDVAFTNISSPNAVINAIGSYGISVSGPISCTNLACTTVNNRKMCGLYQYDMTTPTTGVSSYVLAGVPMLVPSDTSGILMSVVEFVNVAGTWIGTTKPAYSWYSSGTSIYLSVSAQTAGTLTRIIATSNNY